MQEVPPDAHVEEAELGGKCDDSQSCRVREMRCRAHLHPFLLQMFYVLALLLDAI